MDRDEANMMFDRVEAEFRAAFAEIDKLEERIRQLEKHTPYPHAQSSLEKAVAAKEAAARAQGNSCRIEGYHAAKTEAVPMRSDVETILTMTAFCKRLLDIHDLAHAVTLEVRNEARRALGLKKREL